ncbi:unnamed protein product [Symbiodinium sp. CCMP2592]|nr:unnamed protein product [Symbiodinium sp. CCMP2592]
MAATQSRAFWNVSLPVLKSPGGAHITKYQIVKPYKDGVDYDDFLIALPERDHLASFTKEVPLFLRYLKVVTDQEGRGDAFAAFLERAKSGLVVESDVFITSDELLAIMWKNGYSDAERNAIQFTFPGDYKFHYPELSVMFDIPEEDTYKFCMRTRMEDSHIGELDHSKVKREGLIRDHWLIFGTGLFIFKTFPFFNYYFGVKVFGTSMWCYTMWHLLNRMVAKTCRRNEYMASQKTAQEVMEGEDAIVESMRRFANDAKCVEYLKTFKEDSEEKIAKYRKALVLKMKDDLSERAQKQLQAIAAFEVAEDQQTNKERTRALIVSGAFEGRKNNWTVGAAYLIHFGRFYSTAFDSYERQHMDSLASTTTWSVAGNRMSDTLPAVIMVFSSTDEEMEGEIYSLTMQAWETLMECALIASGTEDEYYRGLPRPVYQEHALGTLSVPCRPFPEVLSDNFQWEQLKYWKRAPETEEEIEEILDAVWDAYTTVTESCFCALDACCLLSGGTIHTFYFVLAAAVFTYNCTFGSFNLAEFINCVRHSVWETGSYFGDFFSQIFIAHRMSQESQLGTLLESRSGGICHYCLPTGYQFQSSDDKAYVDAIAYAHRCNRCTLRHLVTWDRPRYVSERYHHKLLHRCQHVICADRTKLRGMLANINLTHSNLVDDPGLDKRHSYETYLAHAVRAELMILGGSFEFLPFPSGLGVATPQVETSEAATGLSGGTKTPADIASQTGASRFIKVGAPLIPYTTAPPGTVADHAKVIVEWEKVDLRKDLASKMEASAALDADAQICVVDDELLDTHGITAKARVCMPGITNEDLAKIHVATNTHENALAAIGNRHYAEKDTELEYEGIKIRNAVGNPSELIRRSLHSFLAEIVPTIMDIDEAEIKRTDVEVVEIPMSEIVSEAHGKTIFPIHKLIAEIAPNSFTEKMIDDNYEATSGSQMLKDPVTKAFVKPNETLGKVKPRLIQHKGPQGTAMNSLMNKTIEESLFRLSYFLVRPIKGTDHRGVSNRMLQFYQEFRDGGFSSTDFGSFDSSVTDKCTKDLRKPGLRRIVEEALMKAVAEKFPDSADLGNASRLRWKKQDRVLFDSLTLLVSVMIRYSGDGLTSVGNYFINWSIDRTVDALAEGLFTIWDWSSYTLAEIVEALPSFLEDKAHIEHLLDFVKQKAKYTSQTIARESKGVPVKKADSEFMCGEGDDKVKAYRWKFIQHFTCRDKKGKSAREVLGIITGVLFVLAGMCLEPQDRSGRVSVDRLIDPTNRIEFTSRIFVPVLQGTYMVSFPKLRKTFAAATVTFNVTDVFDEAAVTKMLSIMSMCDQCVLQFAFYSMLCRFYMSRVRNNVIKTNKRKYEWWEYKLILLISDNSIANTFQSVYSHLKEKAGRADPGIQSEVVAALAKETRLEKHQINDLVDAFDGEQGDDLGSVSALVQRYAAVLPPV